MNRRVSKRLTAIGIKNLSKPGLHADGDGLYVRVARSGAKTWVFIFQWQKCRKEMGLGSVRDMDLKVAREHAIDLRRLVQAGRNPIIERKVGRVAQVNMPSFKAYAFAYIDKMEGQWRNAKHRAQWRSTIETHARPIHEIAISEVSTTDIVGVLLPIWQRIPETASRLRGRIESILDAAKAERLREGDNPAKWAGHLENLLPPRQKLTRGHHAALPYEDLPAFMAELRSRRADVARALEFHILCASRPGMVEAMTPDEVDLEARVWTVPADKMKGGRAHVVPLSDRALQLVESQLKTARGDILFYSTRPGHKMSNSALRRLLDRMGYGHVTPHGFRSSFKDWAGDETDHDDLISEHALAHKVGDDTHTAYRRRTALQKRRILMQQWADYLASAYNEIRTGKTLPKISISN
ncbi:integrase arm-type DNA-binding domain-containing protein [Asticcacaulis sp.]|uniref:tyrosine-type recombinase/integrase n=1 Tax=Asticcacaulis sp. TaxID=1872648 RepID=UPI0031CFB154